MSSATRDGENVLHYAIEQRRKKRALPPPSCARFDYFDTQEVTLGLVDGK
jgi:hypothetical protein